MESGPRRWQWHPPGPLCRQGLCEENEAAVVVGYVPAIADGKV
jgi:hypothetical protein